MMTSEASSHAGTPSLFKVLLLAALLTAVTAACGNRGPLYLPDEPPPSGVAASGDPDSGEAAPGAAEAREETQDDAYGHEGDEEN